MLLKIEEVHDHLWRQQYLADKFGPEKATTLNTYVAMKCGMKNVCSRGNNSSTVSKKAQERIDTYSSLARAKYPDDWEERELDGETLFKEIGKEVPADILGHLIGVQQGTTNSSHASSQAVDGNTNGRDSSEDNNTNNSNRNFGDDVIDNANLGSNNFSANGGTHD